METQFDDPTEVINLAVAALKSSIVHSFQVMVGLEATLGEVYLQSQAGNVQRSVAGVIGWGGDWTGTGILDCSPEFAAVLANLMLGTTDSSLNEDSLDAVAEMTNIAFGGMKSTIESRLGPMSLSTPTVIFGNHMAMRGTRDGYTVIPVEVEGHKFTLKLCIVRRDERRNSPSHFWGGAGNRIS